jgi:hypothetical protein
LTQPDADLVIELLDVILDDDLLEQLSEVYSCAVCGRPETLADQLYLRFVDGAGVYAHHWHP